MVTESGIELMFELCRCETGGGLQECGEDDEEAEVGHWIAMNCG